MKAARAAGFTLIELLVALFITAILFAMGYGALTQAINSRKEVEEQAARLNALQQAMRVVEQDIGLMQPRPVRNTLGDGYLAPLVVNPAALCGGSTTATGTTLGSANLSGPGSTAGGSSASPSANSATQLDLALISFTRGGWANPAGLPRSELQRVGYLLREGKLIRQHLPELDTTAAVVLEERELLDQVDELRFRFMDANGSLNWQCTWPTPIMQHSTPAELLRARPVAVEITLKLKDYGELVRIIEVAG
jgi:general secretion pathway protein J